MTMMKTFVKPIIQVKSGKPTGRRPVQMSIGVDHETESLVDLSATEYRLVMHCRGPEPEDTGMSEQQQESSTKSQIQSRKP